LLDITAFAALIKRKRGEARLTQETLALDVFGDSARKADISRLENAKVPKPQEATVQKICKALDISPAEMEPIRQSRLSAAQLDHIPTLSREELQELAARFGIENPFDRSDTELRAQLKSKADEHRALVKEIETLKGLSNRIDNIHAAALHAAESFDYTQANTLLENAREIHTQEIMRPAIETNARLLEAQADIALLRGKVDHAYALLCAAADSFAAIDPLEPVRRRILRYSNILWTHGLRYGGKGLGLAQAIVEALLTPTLKDRDAWLWAAGQNCLAIALQNQGSRSDGEKGADLLAQAVTAYRAALKVCTRADHPVQWAITQNNLGIALQNQGSRSDGEKGTELLAHAVTAYHAALKVRTRADHPVDWAMTQNNLGNALATQGSRSDGEKGADLLAQAVTAYRAALKVRTRADHPVQWAETQENIAIAQEAIANHDSCADPHAALQAALAAVENALTVYDPAKMPYDYGTATKLRDRIQSALDASGAS
jgi:transcriptional regulator with XRE-family HTH domain